MFHASLQCRQSSFLCTNSFFETRQHDKERAFLSDVNDWSKSTRQLKQEKLFRFSETEILTKNDEEKLRKKENLIDYGTLHCYNSLSPPYSKVQSNLGNGNGDTNSYSGEWPMSKPANNVLHSQVVPMQSNKKYSVSQNGKGSIMRHVPNVSPNGRNRNISLGKVNSVLKTSQFTEAANGISKGVAVEEFSKVIVNGSGTKMMEVLATAHKPDIKERLNGVYESVLVVDGVSAAKEVVSIKERLNGVYESILVVDGVYE
ncbi:uncharacterized protein LOC111783840 [Cucurbita pepo subsp. pepo]|uniref:uncharacterized protein LOC111783840 n=1 Tax=Cucurbita pepo subsp. pepo TaxID=3664 RepID=UPI000C9D91AF|nr:uncharacterized protein LOC111783840 [Cucurbita pepo subsp. pepo]